MRILIINKKDTAGGAARAAHRLHRGLIKAGIDSHMLVMEKYTEDELIHQVKTSWFYKYTSYIDKIVLKKYNKNETLFSPAIRSTKIISKIKELNPDIIHLHWIPRGFISIENLKKLDKPVMWSLHDMWPFTGGCHYDNLCGKYITGCGKCPNLNSDTENDLSKKVFRRKEKAYGFLNGMTVVGLSRWMADQAKVSILFKNKNVINLPNCIDVQLYKPLDRTEIRKKLKLPLNKKIILFGAINATTDKNKGYKYLKEALNGLDSKDIELLIFGNRDLKNLEQFNIPAHYLGNITEEKKLIELYSAADVTIVPSLMENLSNIIMESLACGTPVIAFKTGGNEDMIEHMKSGYIADFKDSESMKNGIVWILEDDNRLKQISENCRLKVLKDFDEKVVIQKYINEYKLLLNPN